MGATIRTARYRYTEWAGGIMGMELYDYRADPDELTNVAIEPEHRTARSRLAAELAARRAQATTAPIE